MLQGSSHCILLFELASYVICLIAAGPFAAIFSSSSSMCRGVPRPGGDRDGGALATTGEKALTEAVAAAADAAVLHQASCTKIFREMWCKYGSEYLRDIVFQRDIEAGREEAVISLGPQLSGGRNLFQTVSSLGYGLVHCQRQHQTPTLSTSTFRRNGVVLSRTMSTMSRTPVCISLGMFGTTLPACMCPTWPRRSQTVERSQWLCCLCWSWIARETWSGLPWSADMVLQALQRWGV